MSEYVNKLQMWVSHIFVKYENKFESPRNEFCFFLVYIFLVLASQSLSTAIRHYVAL